MPEFQPMTPQELDAVQYSSNPADHRWLATVRDREARLRRAVEACRRASTELVVQGQTTFAAFKGGLSLKDELKGVVAGNADLLKGESP